MAIAGTALRSTEDVWPVLQVDPYPAAYRGLNFVDRLSIKLFACTPEKLPIGLRDHLTGWLSIAPAGAEAFMRPGCLQLTVQYITDAAVHSAAMKVRAACPWRLARPTVCLLHGHSMPCIRMNRY